MEVEKINMKTSKDIIHKNKLSMSIPNTKSTKVYECPLVDWYRFKECTITTCKFWTENVSSKCLALHRQTPTGNKSISDAELHYYKFNKRINRRMVAIKRKKAVYRVKATLIYYEYLSYLQLKYIPLNKPINMDIAEKLKTRFPFTLKNMDWIPWLDQLFDQTIYINFLTEKSGECKQFKSVYQILNLGHKKFLLYKRKLKRAKKS
jgi:hypothetical protein